MIGIIYKATNVVNGKVYIGQTTKSLNERIYEHLRDARKNKGFHFHDAIRKYGEENFKWEKIDEANSLDQLCEKEIFWIDKSNSYSKKKDSHGYNETRGGKSLSGENNPMFGRTHSEESRLKIKIKRKNQKNVCGENHHFFGKEPSKEMRKRISVANLGGNNPSAKAIVQFTLDGEFVAEYLTVKEGAKAVNGTRQHISKCCKGRQMKHKNFKWVYKDDYEKGEKIDYLNKLSTNTQQIKPVIQLSFLGDFVKEYPSINEAARTLEINASNISRCCKGKIKSYKGYLWIFKDDFDINSFISPFLIKEPICVYKKEKRRFWKSVVQLTLDWKFVAEYEKVNDGAKAVNGMRQRISACCKGKRNHHKGSRWMYKEDYVEFEKRLRRLKEK